MIRALARDPELAARTQYHVLGGVDGDERQRLEALSAEVGFQGLHLEGRVSDGQTVKVGAEGGELTINGLPVSAQVRAATTQPVTTVH